MITMEKPIHHIEIADENEQKQRLRVRVSKTFGKAAGSTIPTTRVEYAYTGTPEEIQKIAEQPNAMVTYPEGEGPEFVQWKYPLHNEATAEIEEDHQLAA